MKKTSKKQIVVILILVLVIAAIVFTVIGMLNYYSSPSKSERLANMIKYEGRTTLNEFDVAEEIDMALAKYSNWDNLFLSEHFKSKFINRKSIIEQASSIENVWCCPEIDNPNIIIVNAEHKQRIFEDDTDAITTEYYYEYSLDENGEIDDLTLIKKLDVSTFNGEPIENP